MQRFKNYVKDLPKIYRAYFAIVLLAEIVIIALRPDEPGLYTFPPQCVPLALALVFLPFKKIRKAFTRWIYTYSSLSFIFLAIDYNSFNHNGAGHAGLIHIATTFLPAGLFWIFKFICWNVRRVKERDSRTALILSVFAWGLYAFAFPPMPLGPAALLLLVPWFIVLNRFGRQQALFATFWSAVLYNTINYYWIYNVMNVETAPSGLILFGLFLLIAYFSAYNVLAAFIYTIVKNVRIKGHRVLLWIYPVFYAGIEMTRTRGDFSFPWSHLGYVFGNHVEFLQMLPWIGIFGYTVLVVASNQVVAGAFERLAGNLKNRQELKKTVPLLSVPVILLLALFLQGTYVLSKPEAAPFYGAENKENPSIALVQPSIAQGAKWSKERFDNIVNKTLGMVKDSVPPGTDLIVLAETAIPDYIRRQPKVIRRLHRLADEMQGSILTGTLDYKRNDPGSIRTYDIYNSAFLFTPNDISFPKRYIKKHLVPFSERIPFDDIFPILNYVDLGEGDFVTGKETPVYGPFKWTPYICYDAIFGDLIREAIREGSRLMVNITNDGWFGRSTAPYQHMNLIRYRAIENGMPVARLANSGVSLFIDQYGHYNQNTDIFVDAVIQRKMPLKTRDTLYSHIGDAVETALLWFFLIYLLASLGFFFKNFKTSRTEA
ncbi:MULTISPECIES: apolipoprotein N-acyltransferase [unclassified Fibrobacter]|uniref:apolipoprotein N-acyltransferase n=1 Tax=unclassified Fibrobacter TaxID=2634177 RepID=UPI000D6CAE96|nr:MULTISPECIES: apolipoprotein N-acyltransferase [unclassified Fibrobacter]PWJ71804.1 apolipoprotein N-acyltransferase [Fibrobacter sp. UWR4]PZW73719.1 apolipoprotein N-acyltransferase [Fibrobacter sp. UWR1]